MAVTFVAGHKTFTQGLAIIACKFIKYSVKYNAKLQKYLTPTQYACLSSVTTCLQPLCGLKNKSAP